MTSAVGVITLTPVELHSFRRELLGELAQIRDVIKASKLSDDLTETINSWQKRFTEDLHTSVDEHAICDAYIDVMQELLTDPVTGAPLDPYAELGNDGYTYGYMSRKVYKYSVPCRYRKRSPMNPEDPTHFTHRAHPVARHMVGWLQKHGALLYSEELEKAYLELLPQQKPMDIEERIDQILARQAELDRVEAEARGLHILDLENRLQQIAAMDAQRLQALQGRIERRENPFQAVQAEIDAAQKEGHRSMEELKEKIKEIVNQKLAPLGERIEGYTQYTLEELDEIAAKNAHHLAQLKEKIEGMEVEIANLEQQNKELTQSQTQVNQSIAALKVESVTLQKNINETKIAVQKMKERSANAVLRAVAIVAVSCFATWAVQGLIQSGAINISFVPQQGGGMARAAWSV